MKVKLISHTPDPEKTVAAAAKLCYAKSDIGSIMDNLDEEKTTSFIGMLSDLGHESPIEHASFTFGIEGVSRTLLAQITRHRIASYSVQSQRYVNKENFEYIIPPEIEKDKLAKEEFIKAMDNARESYIKIASLLKKTHVKDLIYDGISASEADRKAEKMAIEDARFVLPNACDTRMIITMNARSLINFFNQRCCNRAQWEIRNLAYEMLKLCKEAAPNLFKNAGPKCLCGTCPEGKMSCGKIREVREYCSKL